MTYLLLAVQLALRVAVQRKQGTQVEGYTEQAAEQRVAGAECNLPDRMRRAESAVLAAAVDMLRIED